MSAAMNNYQRPAYKYKHFVARRREQEVFIDLIQKWLDAPKATDKRVLTFIGEYGVGKTWLLSRLIEELSQNGDRHDGMRSRIPLLIEYNLADHLPILISANERQVHQKSQEETPAITLPLMQLLKDTYRKIVTDEPGAPLQGNTLKDMSQFFMQAMNTYLEKYPLVIFIDSVFEAEWPLLEQFEDYFLGPLAINPNVFIVMAGRGRPYPWKTPELRYNALFYQVAPFNKDETAEQVKAQEPSKASEAPSIYAKSRGIPYVNYLLVEGGDIQKALCKMLGVIPDEQVRKKIIRYQEIFQNQQKSHRPIEFAKIKIKMALTD